MRARRSCRPIHVHRMRVIHHSDPRIIIVGIGTKTTKMFGASVDPLSKKRYNFSIIVRTLVGDRMEDNNFSFFKPEIFTNIYVIRCHWKGFRCKQQQDKIYQLAIISCLYCKTNNLAHLTNAHNLLERNGTSHSISRPNVTLRYHSNWNHETEMILILYTFNDD